ncbi:hypothetical protein [Flammeovirga sp. OC4]|uniref:hypothetical protein n=1 Tax=Flammeovirga sp. OC4 TaxID=1382345 RepID=UPI0012E08158|nr:hypothetical protein [Flammeovirga sp. OC4]
MDKSDGSMIISILLILGVLVVGINIIRFLISSGKKAKKDDPYALGLPQGSVRAVLSISLILFFILIALFFYNDSTFEKAELAESTLTILGTLVIAVSSFYFGIKATEQGSKIAKDTLKDLSDHSKSENQNVPPEIILKAIAQNKELWKQQYQSEDVKLGKKQSANTQFDVNCLQFLVKSKLTYVNTKSAIPVFVYFTADSKNYSIPTDVVVISGNETTSLNEKVVTLNLIDEALIENKEMWLKMYGAEDILAALKVKGELRQKVPCIQFIVACKSNQLDTQIIPKYITYQNYNIPTDVVEKDGAGIDTSDIQVGDAVWRQGTTAKGTLGIKVYRDNADGSKTDFLLSCYHVFCSSELSNGTKKYTSTSNSSIVAKINGNTTEIAKVVEGELNTKLDAALSEINSNVSVDNHLKGFLGIPKYGIRLITNQEVIDETTVFTYGARTKKAISGTVISRVASPNIKLNGKKVRFKNVIPVTKISVKGDSGAMVVDDKGKIIGIIFASDSKTSYVVPILEIITHFRIKIYYA